jgi:hypothetical protein
VKDRAALGIIEAAEANGRYVHLSILFLPRDLSYSAYMACMAVCISTHFAHSIDIKKQKKKIPKTDFD